MKRKWLSGKKKSNKGFTLVELVIVIAILAILVGLLAPQYTKYVEKTRKTADVDNLDEMVRAFQVAVADSAGGAPAGSYSITIMEYETIFFGPTSEIPTRVNTVSGSTNSTDSTNPTNSTDSTNSTNTNQSTESDKEAADRDKTEASIVNGAYDDLYDSMCEALGDDWLDTELKSSYWQKNGISSIAANIMVGSDGSISVSYDPGTLKDVTAKIDGESDEDIPETTTTTEADTN